MVKQFINDYGFTIIYAALTAICGVIGAKIKSIYQEKVNNDYKKEAVETVVKATEQLYQTLSGAEKLEAAKSSLMQMLEQKGISISEIEMDMLIESCVAQLNFDDMRITKKEESDNGESDLQ